LSDVFTGDVVEIWGEGTVERWFELIEVDFDDFVVLTAFVGGEVFGIFGGEGSDGASFGGV
jgi:hypothetical protein